METIVKLNNCPLSPRKMRLLADMVRGMDVDKAMYSLRLNNKKAYAIYLEKLIKSGIASWTEKNPEESIESAELFVKAVMVDGGRVMKRVQPAPQGRAYRVRKRSNHITLTIASRFEGQVMDTENSDNQNNSEENN
jgi:large subunit ribosomal protein L22